MKKLRILGVAFALTFLSGCITIIEKYTINADGSGTMEYVIDMSEMYEMMASFSDSAQEPESIELDKSLRDALPVLNTIDGISKVELTGDVSRYIAGIKFDFKNVQALNKALGVILEGEANTGTETQYVSLKGKTFTRFSLTSKDFNKEELLSSQELDEETTKMMLESMKYQISITLEKPVKKVTTLAHYTMEDNTVLIDSDFSQIFDNTEVLKTVIKTK
jgi:hypothetical protein